MYNFSKGTTSKNFPNDMLKALSHLILRFNSFDMRNGTFSTTFYAEKYPFFPYHKYHVTDM
jgi:hypothetical protein